MCHQIETVKLDVKQSSPLRRVDVNVNFKGPGSCLCVSLKRAVVRLCMLWFPEGLHKKADRLPSSCGCNSFSRTHTLRHTHSRTHHTSCCCLTTGLLQSTSALCIIISSLPHPQDCWQTEQCRQSHTSAAAIWAPSIAAATPAWLSWRRVAMTRVATSKDEDLYCVLMCVSFVAIITLSTQLIGCLLLDLPCCCPPFTPSLSFI